MDNRPNLPALESVATRSQEMLPALMIMMALLLLAPILMTMALMLGYYRQYLDVQTWVLVGAISALLLWIAARMLSGYFYYGTDPSGITLRGPLRRTFVAWGEVREAYTREAAGETILVIETSNGTLTLAPRSIGGKQGDLVIASIRQHLARLGKADRITLPGSALSLWDTIPDELPGEMEWRGPSRVGDCIAVAFLVVLFCGPLVYLWSDWSKPLFLVSFVVPLTIGVAFLFRFLLPCLLKKADLVVLQRYGLEARLIGGKVMLPWSEVSTAYWGKEGLTIKSDRTKTEVQVPWLPKDETSSQLILAIIRRLRTAGAPQAVPIPESLRRFDLVPANEDTVELRLSKSEVRFITWGIGGFLAVPAAALPFGPNYSPVALGVICALAVAWLLVAGRLIGSYYIRIDSQGFSRGFLGKNWLIKWEDVARVAWGPAKRGMMLKNAKGKTITEISLGFGPQQDRLRLMTMLRSRLDSIGEPAKPWLARPWTANDADES